LIAHRSQGGSVFAMDVSEQRLATVATTVALQRLNNITLVIADAGSSLPFRNESFDRVLVDAPCSGTGTLRHNPEIRWRLKNDDIPELARQQLRFLLNASMAVKQNGLLVYSTCSVELEENEEVVEQFLSTNKLFEQIPVIVNERLLMPEGSARTW